MCWYFSWNPATLLSEKLRSFQKPPESRQVSDSTVKPGKEAPLFKIVQVKKNEKTDEELTPEKSDPKNLPDQ